MTEATLTVRAHAKINVFLRVLNRSVDGYHALETLIVPIDLRDDVSVTSADTLTLQVTGERAADVPAGPDNLALRTAAALGEAAGFGPGSMPGADIRIHKRIPAAAGMGGGSADAAATLRALNELWDTGLDQTGLSTIASTLGSDVPALLASGAVFATGRGEHVTPVRMPTTWWVIRPFPFGVRTPDAFAWWDLEGTTGPDPRVVVAAAEAGNVAPLGSSLFNDLQGPVCARHPEVADVIEAFEEAGAFGAVMTGSGPTVVAVARDLEHATGLAEAVPGSIVTTGPPPSAGSAPQAG